MEDSLSRSAPFEVHTLTSLAFGSIQYCSKLDLLPRIWRYQRNEDIPDLMAGFQTVIPRQVQSLCRHWPTILRQADIQDDVFMSAAVKSVPDLLYWVAAMGVMAELDNACRGLYELERCLVRQHRVGGLGNFLTFPIVCLFRGHTR